MKNGLLLVSMLGLVFTACESSWAQEAAPGASKLGGQVFFRGGGGFLTEGNRGGGFYTDAGGDAGLNNGTSGFSMGFGLDIPLMKDPWLGNTVLGEILIDYAQFSDKTVRQTTSLVVGPPTLSAVAVSELAIVGAPKYRFEGYGRLRPWVIPVGMAFFVNSPPTNDSTYLDVGLHFGTGIEYMLTENLSIGADWRYNLNVNFTNSPAGDFMTTGVYLGFNF